jgi:alanyl-tRNA synthetase
LAARLRNRQLSVEKERKERKVERKREVERKKERKKERKTKKKKKTEKENRKEKQEKRFVLFVSAFCHHSLPLHLYQTSVFGNSVRYDSNGPSNCIPGHNDNHQ